MWGFVRDLPYRPLAFLDGIMDKPSTADRQLDATGRPPEGPVHRVLS